MIKRTAAAPAAARRISAYDARALSRCSIGFSRMCSIMSVPYIVYTMISIMTSAK